LLAIVLQFVLMFVLMTCGYVYTVSADTCIEFYRL